MLPQAAATTPVPRRSDRSARTIWGTWAVTAFALSWILWGLNASFYARLGVGSADWPAWTLIETILGPSALVAWVVTLVVVGWRRRYVVPGLIAVAAFAALATFIWIGHEAERARSGVEVRSGAAMAVVGGVRFSASEVTLFPLGQELPAGLSSPQVLLLRTGRGRITAYDPDSRRVWTLDGGDYAMRYSWAPADG